MQPTDGVRSREAVINVKFEDGSSIEVYTTLRIWHAMFKTYDKESWADFDKASEEGRTIKIQGTVIGAEAFDKLAHANGKGAKYASVN